MLGNSSCNKVHFKWITIPEILNKLKINSSKNPKQTYLPKYVEERDNAIINGSKTRKPCFLAIIITSNIDIIQLTF